MHVRWFFGISEASLGCTHRGEYDSLGSEFVKAPCLHFLRCFVFFSAENGNGEM